MKTPVTYYGGKQRLAARIIQMIPEHNLYCEPFLGGGAVFFAKEKSNVEVINDTNRELINFYQMVKHEFVSLEKEIAISLHSRDLHRRAMVIYQNPDMFSSLKRAWAVWLLASQCFASSIGDSWGYDKKKPTTSRRISNKRINFTEDYAIRLQEVQIECADAIYIIKSRDMDNSFFYCDPPYYNSDMGHYDGYTLDDFENLLKALSQIKGKFLLSSYPSEILKRYTKDFGWHTVVYDQKVSISKNRRKSKQEVLTANYFIKK